MTLQDLKDNRNETIAYLENSEYDVKEVMNEMVKYIGFNGIRSTDVISYANEVIALAGVETKANKAVVAAEHAAYVANGYRTQAEVNHDNGRKLYFA